MAAIVVVAVAMVLGSVLLVVVLRRTLVGSVDDTARRRAHDVAALIRQDALPKLISATGQETAVVQVIDSHGRVLASTANLVGRDPILSDRPAGSKTEVRTVTRLPVVDEEDDEFRVASLLVSVDREVVTVHAAESLERVDESVGVVRNGLVVGSPLLLGVVGVTSWLIVGRALRPVEDIREQVAEISASDLGRRVPDPATEDEIGRLARTMNEMLERLEAFTDRQRRFVADASHELQSPLATSLADLEVALADPERTNWPDTAAGVAADAQRMTRLVQDLLFLARADDPAALVPPTLLDLDDVVLEEISRFRARSRMTVDASGVMPAEVRGNSEQLARVVRNLLDNAGRYARSRVTVEVSRDDDAVVLAVTDDGPGVPAQDHHRVFERFTRLDESRDRATGGAGLGLAIASEIVQHHGGSIALESNGSGARFVVRLPVP